MSTALITGTTSGLGYEFARLFAQDNYNLVLVSRNIEKLKKQKEKLEKEFSIHVSVYAFDLSKPNVAKEVFETVNEQIDILVNNAGFYEYGNFHESNLGKELEMVELHNTFLTALTGYYVQGMVQRKQGKILNIASAAAFVALPYGAVYGATKSYVLSFSKALHVELKQHGVSVSALCPGATETEFAKKSDIESTPLFNGVVMKADKVAAIGYRGLMKHKTMIVPGWYTKGMYVSSKIAPVAFVNKMLVWMMRKK